MSAAANGTDFSAHQQTYKGFIRGSIALVLACAYVLVALVSVGFAHSFPVLIAFLGLIFGTIALLIDLKTGSKKWLLSGGLLLVFALVTAANIT